MIKRLALFFSVCIFVLCGCTSKAKEKIYNIGIDPAWFSVDISEKKTAVYGFCIELIDDFSRESGIKIAVHQSNWDTLLDSVNRDVFDGVFSGLQPSVETNTDYAFSEPVLLTGPVFVSANEEIKDIVDLKGMSLSIENGNEIMLNYALTFDQISLEYYDSYAKAIYKLSQKEIPGALIPAIIARSFEQSLYKDKIFIQSQPLIDEGIRLVTKKGHNHYLMQEFSHYLKKIKAKRYGAMLKKWDLA